MHIRQNSARQLWQVGDDGILDKRPRKCLGGACVEDSFLGRRVPPSKLESAHAKGHAPPKRLRGFSMAERFDRPTAVMVSEPAWVPGQKHRPFVTRRRAERPVSEGPHKVRGRVVKTNPVSTNRCLMGVLGYLEGSGIWAGKDSQSRAITLGEPMSKEKGVF